MFGVLHLLAQALAGFAVTMLAPAGIAYAAGEYRAGGIFLVVAGLVGFLSGAGFLALRGRVRRLDRVAGFMLVVAIWVVPPLIAAIPFVELAGVDYVTALFEATSGYTTTGATALPSLGPLGFSGVFFRSQLQWLGGLMTLATVVTIIAPSGLGGVSPVALVTGAEGRLNRIQATLRQVTIAYVLVTVACAALLLTTDIPPFDAVCLALSTVSTGGFMPIAGDLSAYRSTYADLIIAVFMLVGATSIAWHRMIIEGRWAMAVRHREGFWLIGMGLAVGLLYAAAFAVRGGEWTIGGAIRDGFVTGASLVSTTGFNAHPGALAGLPEPIVLLLALVGGAAISTAGGLKYFRIGGMLTLSLQELRRLVYPHSIRRARFGSLPYNLELMKSIWSSLVVGLLVVVLATLLIASTEPAFDGALTAAISAFSNIGPLYATGWPGTTWPAYADFGVLAKLVMIVTMILGRFEVMVLLGALNFAYWRS